MNVEPRGDLEKEEIEGVFKNDCEKKDDFEEEKKDEVEEEKEKRALDKEERWKKIKKRRRLRCLHAPPLPFHTKR